MHYRATHPYHEKDLKSEANPALRLAWYKIYYPIHFYSAYFTVRGGDIDAVAAVAGKAAVKKKMEEIKNKFSAAVVNGI